LYFTVTIHALPEVKIVKTEEVLQRSGINESYVPVENLAEA